MLNLRKLRFSSGFAIKIDLVYVHIKSATENPHTRAPVVRQTVSFQLSDMGNRRPKRGAAEAAEPKPEKSKFQHLMDSFIVDRPIPKSLRASFPDVEIYQRYNPGLTLFKPKKKLTADSTFNTRGTLVSWTPSEDSKDKRFGIGKIVYTNGITADQRVFVKTIHLLDPIAYLDGIYGDCMDDDWLPLIEGGLEERYKKLHCAYNQAYIDAITQAVLSRLKEENITTNVLECYGAVVGMKENYTYDITDDYASLRVDRGFWDSLAMMDANLVVESDEPVDPDVERSLIEPPDDIFDSENEDDDSDGDSDGNNSNSASSKESDGKSASTAASSSLGPFTASTSMPSLELDESSSIEAEELEAPPSPSVESSSSSELIMDNISIESDHEKPILHLCRTSARTCTHSTSGSSLSDAGIRIKINFKRMPVLLLFQEAADGTMDELLEEEATIMDGLNTPSGMKEHMGSCDGLDNIINITRIERDQRWSAWLAQVVAVLSQLQALMCFSHNDLHTNNIVWTKTADQFIYYETNAGKVYKVPTYGKRFHIIDFGRATFALGDKVFLSDDFFPGNDAAGQYNYDVCTDHESPEKPYVEPNMSFDLARLSYSMIEILYDEPPAIKSRTLPPLNVEHGKQVWQTVSDLYNCLWKWVVDDDGCNIIETADGEERFSGFDLYVHIAHHMHGSVPKEQWKNPVFGQFETTARPPATVKLYF